MKTKDIILEQANLVRKRLISQAVVSDGFCYESSCVLQKYLEKYGINTILVEGRVHLSPKIEKNYRFHYYLKYQNKILDITGDQFNKDKTLNIPEVLFEDETLYPMYHQDKLAKSPAIIFGKWPILMLELLESDYETYASRYFQTS